MYFGLIKFGKIATFSISNWGKITIMKILTFEFDHILYFQQFWKDFADLEHCKKKIFLVIFGPYFGIIMFNSFFNKVCNSYA